MKTLELPEELIRLMYFDRYEIKTTSNRETVSEQIYCARFREIKTKKDKVIGYKFQQLMNFEEVALNNRQPKVYERELLIDSQITFSKSN